MEATHARSNPQRDRDEHPSDTHRLYVEQLVCIVRT